MVRGRKFQFWLHRKESFLHPWVLVLICVACKSYINISCVVAMDLRMLSKEFFYGSRNFVWMMHMFVH